MDGQICEPLHLRSDRGCDSLVRLQLEVYPAYFFSDVQAICEGEQLEFSWQAFCRRPVFMLIH